MVRDSRSQWADSIHRFPYRKRRRIAIDPRRAPDVDVDSGSRWNSARRLRRLAAHHGRNPRLEMAGPTRFTATLHPDRPTSLQFDSVQPPSPSATLSSLPPGRRDPEVVQEIELRPCSPQLIVNLTYPTHTNHCIAEPDLVGCDKIDECEVTDSGRQTSSA